jgi:hypothetical protein
MIEIAETFTDKTIEIRVRMLYGTITLTNSIWDAQQATVKRSS